MEGRPNPIQFLLDLRGYLILNFVSGTEEVMRGNYQGNDLKCPAGALQLPLLTSAGTASSLFQCPVPLKRPHLHSAMHFFPNAILYVAQTYKRSTGC